MKTGVQRMIADIEAEVEYTRSLIGKNALDARVMQAMRSVPRDAFVPRELKDAAWDNGPLPIGQGQTISQPYIVALMTDLLALEPHHAVLEVGTGSGYQTAVLAELCARVYTVEVIPALSERAAHCLRRLHYDNIEMRVGNGYAGWPEHAPYDGIIVTAAASHVPQPLVDQLKPGARLVIPVGLPWMPQELLVISKDADGKTRSRSILGVAFVPLVDDEAEPGPPHTRH